MDWQVRQAKARFSEMVERTLKEGPHTVTRHGKAVAVLTQPMNIAAYALLAKASRRFWRQRRSIAIDRPAAFASRAKPPPSGLSN